MTHLISDSNTFYCISEKNGFAYFNNSRGEWDFRCKGLAKKVVYPFLDNKVRRLTALGVDNSNFSYVCVSDGRAVYLSTNFGKQWNKTLHGTGLSKSIYITAVMPNGKESVYMGSSVRGLFKGKIEGNKINWVSLSKFSDGYYKGGGSYEQVSAIWVTKSANPILFASFGFGEGVYFRPLYKDTTDIISWNKLEVPFNEEINSFYEKDSILFCYTAENRYKYDLLTKEWLPTSDKILKLKQVVSIEKKNRLDRARNRRGLYIRWDKAANEESYDRLLSVIKKEGYNSFVVDMKNDRGVLTYKSKLKIPLSINAVNNSIDLEKLLSKAHSQNLYVIGRIVVFKDQKLFGYKDKSYAVWDNNLNKPWANYQTKTNPTTGKEYSVQKEYWVDPFSKDVWDYNRNIAQELQSMGIDEIQFDYIRFPSDGDVWTATYRHKKEGMSRIDALESFLSYNREKITIPISTDLYGYQSYFRLGNWIGQNIEVFSKYVDVISPMYYPSHFPKSFLADDDYLRWSKRLYKTGCDRSYKITGGNCIIRPYVQAFLMGDEREMNETQYKSYLNYQIEGVSESKGEGFTLWNNSNIYYMLD